jgi:transketolase
VQRIDGHDLKAVMAALEVLKPAGEGKPQLIIADTIKGRGVKRMELSLNWHVGNLVGEDYDDAWNEIMAGLQPRVEA